MSRPCFSLRVVGIKRTALLRGKTRDRNGQDKHSQSDGMAPLSWSFGVCFAFSFIFVKMLAELRGAQTAPLTEMLCRRREGRSTGFCVNHPGGNQAQSSDPRLKRQVGAADTDS